MAKILIVDDQRNMRTTLSMMLRGAGYEVDEAVDGEQGADRGATGAYDVVLTDLRMGTKDGIDVLRSTKDSHPLTEVIVMTAYGTIESAVEAMRLGAFDYIQKPFTEQELLVKVAKALDNRRLAGEVTFLANEFKDRYRFENIIGQSRAVREVLGRIVRIAPTDAIVLITGESGTGKELVAKAIHANSKRGERPFVPVNCAAITETLLESELFGHAKGPLRGSRRRHLLLRRDRRDPHHVPGQASARDSGERDPTGRREQTHPYQRPRDRGDQPGPLDRGGREALPPGPLLPPERRKVPAAPAARTAGGHPRSSLLLPREVLAKDGRSAAPARRGHRSPHALRLPGKHPGARAHDRAGRRARPKRGHHGRRRPPPPAELSARTRGGRRASLGGRRRRGGTDGHRGRASRKRRQPREGGRAPQHFADHALAEDDASRHHLRSTRVGFAGARPRR